VSLSLKTSRRLFYILHCLYRLTDGFVAATFILFMYSTGMDELKTNIVISVCLISTFMTEVPAGAFSDAFGRRKTLMTCGLLLTLGYTLFLLGSSIVIFLFAQVILGAAQAFMSGSLESWLLDYFDLSPDDVDQVYIRKNRYITILVLVSGFLGAVIGDWNIRLIFLVPIFASIAFTVLVFTLITDQPKPKAQPTSHANAIRLAATDGFMLLKSHGIRQVILYNAILTFSFASVFIFWQPVLYQYGEHVFLLGVMWILMQISTYAGNHFVKKIYQGSQQRYQLLYGITGLLGIVLFIPIVHEGFYTVLIALLGFEFLYGSITPLKEASINTLSINGSNRATILSIESMCMSISYYVSILLMGWIASMLSKMATWYISGSMLIVLSIFSLANDHKNIKR